MVAIKKQLFLYKVQNKNIMATFTELQCFNKLLLQKIKRMEEHHKREMQERNSKIFNSYESLKELVLSASYGIEPSYLQCCDLCHVWHNIDEDDDLLCVDEDDCEYVCTNCLNGEPNCIYKMCCDCNKIININYQPTLKNNDGDFICETCYRKNIAKIIHNVIGERVFIDRHVHNSNLVHLEILGNYSPSFDDFYDDLF